MAELAHPALRQDPSRVRDIETAWTPPGPAAPAAPAGTPAAFSWPLAQLAVVPTLYWIGFDADAFDLASFAEAGITLPGHIAGAVPKRQAEFFYGRLCAQAALRPLDCHCTVGTGPMREPVWPEGVVGSISHGSALACAVALDSSACRGIGIDIEQTAASEAQHAIRRMVVSAREHAVLAALAHKIDIGVLLTLVFSAKESFFKASFKVVGRYFDFDAIEVKAIDPERCEIRCCVTTSLCAAWPAGMPLRISYMVLPQGQVATLFAW